MDNIRFHGNRNIKSIQVSSALNAFNYRTSKKFSFRKILQAVIMSTNTDVSLSSYDEDQGSKFIRKAKEAPFVPIGKSNFDILITSLP
jgi:hypothetical protein